MRRGSSNRGTGCPNANSPIAHLRSVECGVLSQSRGCSDRSSHFCNTPRCSDRPRSTNPISAPASEVRPHCGTLDTNFGSVKGHWQRYDSSVAFRFEVPQRSRGKWCRNFKSAALVNLSRFAGQIESDSSAAIRLGPHHVAAHVPCEPGIWGAPAGSTVSRAATMSTQEHVFSDDEALNWLRTQPDGQTAATITALAQEWRWTRNKVSKRLNQWMSDGLIARTPGRDRRWIISAVSASVLAPALPVPRPVVADDVERAEPTIGAAVSEPMVATGSMVAPMVASEPMVAPVVASPPVPLVDRAEPVPLVDRAAPARFEHARIRRPFPLVRMVTSLVLAALAAAIAWFGIRINAWYGATLGRTAEASMLLAGLSVSADVLAFTLPVAARTLWIECRHAASALAWGLWTIVTAIALLATIGFAALNIADTTAARGKVVDDAAVLAARGERLRAERASITETRSVATIEAELQRAQPGAIAVWRATDGCRDVTLPESGKACATVLALRQALGAAQ